MSSFQKPQPEKPKPASEPEKKAHFELKPEISLETRVHEKIHIDFSDMLRLLNADPSSEVEIRELRQYAMAHFLDCESCLSQFISLQDALELFEKLKGANRILLTQLLAKNRIPEYYFMDVQGWYQNGFPIQKAFNLLLSAHPTLQWVKIPARVFDLPVETEGMDFLEDPDPVDPFQVTLKQDAMVFIRPHAKGTRLIVVFRLAQKPEDPLVRVFLNRWENGLDIPLKIFDPKEAYVFILEGRA